MKKNLPALLCSLLLSSGTYAQITLNSSSYTSTYAGTVDTFLSSGTGTTNPTNLGPGTNATWDMTTAVLATPVGHDYNVSPASSAFTSAQFSDSILNYFSTYSYIANFQRAFTAAGYIDYGEHVNRQATVLPTATTDSLIFIAQDVLYSTPNQLLKFPCTMGSTWSTSYNLTFGFLLDVALFSYTNQPGSLKQYITETDSVVGWGQMRVKKTDGTAGPYQHVLQIRKRIVLTDSFFIGTSPAPPMLLLAFSLTQGSMSGENYVTYYRPNDPYPLADVNYTSGNFDTISSVSTLAQDYNTDLTAGVKELSTGQMISIYPNPVHSNLVNITVPGATDGNWSYELIDITGAKVQSGSVPLSGSNTTTQVTLAEKLSAGIYYVRVLNNGEEIAVSGLDIVK